MIFIYLCNKKNEFIQFYFQESFSIQILFEKKGFLQIIEICFFFQIYLQNNIPIDFIFKEIDLYYFY